MKVTHFDVHDTFLLTGFVFPPLPLDGAALLSETARDIFTSMDNKSKEKNRGLQLDMGAKNSRGDWLIFLHADTRLTHDWLRKIKIGRASCRERV